MGRTHSSYGIIRQSSTQEVQILSELCNKFTLGNFGQATLVAVSRHSSHNGCNHSFPSSFIFHVKVFSPSMEPDPASLCIRAPVVRGTAINWTEKDYGKINNKKILFG